MPDHLVVHSLTLVRERSSAPGAAVAAVALTLAATNAYLSGAAEMLTALAGAHTPFAGARRLPLGAAGVGVVLLALTAAGWVSTSQLVALPTTMFLAVYLVATGAGVHLLTRRTRAAAAIACASVGAVLVFSGATMLLPALVAAAAITPWRSIGRNHHTTACSRLAAAADRGVRTTT